MVDRAVENWIEEKLATARVCAREDREGTRGPEETVPVRKQELASTARVVIAAALGQKLCDVEAARTGQHGIGRAVAQQKNDAWDVGR
jgi:hypothetical protein